MLAVLGCLLGIWFVGNCKNKSMYLDKTTTCIGKQSPPPGLLSFVILVTDCNCYEYRRCIYEPSMDSIELLAPLGKSDHLVLNMYCNSVVTTIEISPPSRWLATIEPPPPPRCCTVFSAVFLALFPENCRHYPQSSYIVSKCRVIWSHTASPRHRPFPSASPSALANDTTASTFSVASQTAFVCSCRDAPGVVLNETVVTVSLSTAPWPSVVRWWRAVRH